MPVQSRMWEAGVQLHSLLYDVTNCRVYSHGQPQNKANDYRLHIRTLLLFTVHNIHTVHGIKTTLQYDDLKQVQIECDSGKNPDITSRAKTT